MTLGSQLAWDDTVLPFQLDASDIRGRLARRRARVGAGFAPGADDLALERDPAVNADDVLDAFVLLWVAGRLARGDARPVGGREEPDARGLAMSIWT